MKVKIRNLKPGDVARMYSGPAVIGEKGPLIKFDYEFIEREAEPQPYDPTVYLVRFKLLRKEGRKVRKQTVIEKPCKLDWEVEVYHSKVGEKEEV